MKDSITPFAYARLAKYEIDVARYIYGIVYSFGSDSETRRKRNCGKKEDERRNTSGSDIVRDG